MKLIKLCDIPQLKYFARYINYFPRCNLKGNCVINTVIKA